MRTRLASTPAAGASGGPLLDGEAEAMRTRQRRSWTLRASRSAEMSAAECADRVCESAWSRGGGQGAAREPFASDLTPRLPAGTAATAGARA